MKHLAAIIPFYNPDTQGLEGIGPLGLQGGSASDSINTFNKVISTTVGIMTVIGIIWFLVMFIGGTISIIGSGGDKAKLEQARSRMFSAVIGLALLVSALFIVDVLGNLIGIHILSSILDIEKVIK